MVPGADGLGVFFFLQYQGIDIYEYSLDLKPDRPWREPGPWLGRDRAHPHRHGYVLVPTRRCCLAAVAAMATRRGSQRLFQLRL